MSQNKTTKTKKSGSKGRKFSTYAILLAALSLAIVIPVNLLASRLNVTWDMTPTSLYKLSETTTSYLDTLDTTVDFYFLMEMDYLQTDDDSMALYYSLKEYSEYDCIHFTDFDPDAHPEILDQINPDGLMNLSIGDIVITNGTNTKRVPANQMFQYQVSYDDEGNSMIEAAYFTGENPITGAIHSVVTGKESTVYFLNGHGEKTMETDYQTFRSNLENINYGAKDLNLATTDAVPEDAEILIVAAPQYDISNDEARKINNYLDQGGSIAFLMSPNDSDTVYKNITGIMEDFGLGMDYDIVRENNSELYVSGDPYTFQTSIVRTDSEDTEDAVNITSEIIDMVDSGYSAFMSNSRSFYQYMNNTDVSLQIGSLMQTVATSQDVLGNSVATAVGEPYGGNEDQAQTIDGGAPLDLAMYSISKSRNDAKVVVFGNSEFIDDTHVSDPQMIVTLNLFLASVTWMYDSDLDLDMGIQDKERSYDYIVVNSESKANGLIIEFLTVPLVLLPIGVVIWLRRRYA